MQARAGAMDELIESGTLEDFTSDKTQLDRELAQMASQSQVESELAKMKQEVGTGDDGGTKQLEGGGEPARRPSQRPVRIGRVAGSLTRGMAARRGSAVPNADADWTARRASRRRGSRNTAAHAPRTWPGVWHRTWLRWARRKGRATSSGRGSIGSSFSSFAFSSSSSALSRSCPSPVGTNGQNARAS